MAETKTVNLEVNSNLAQTEQAFTSLRSELRKAQAEVAAMSDKFGATSKEAIEAAKRAAELKDRIGDAKSLTDTFNPDAKFKALTSSLSGAAGGLSAVTGAMGLLGTQSEDVEAAILKVQSAMAISQGIQAVGESIDSFKQLGAVIKDAGIFQKANTAITAVAATIQKLFTGAVDTTATSFKGLKAAIVSTGIGALVVGLGYLISKMMESSDATEELTDKQKRLNDELEYTKKLTDDTAKSIDYYTNIALANAKKRGASEKELLKIQLDALEEKGKANIKEVEDIQKKQDKEYGLTKEQNKRIQELREQNLDLQRQGNLLLANADAELEQKNKENRKKTKEERNKELEENKKEEKRKREEAEKERAEFQNAKGRAAEAEYDAILKIEEEAREKNRLAGLTEIEQVNEKYNKLIQTAKDAGVSTIELEIEKANAINDIKLSNQEKQKAIDEKEIADAQAVADAKLAIQNAQLDNVSKGIGLLQSLGIKNKAIQKGLVIAENAAGIAKTIINTMAANAKAIAASPLTAGQPFVTANTISGAIGVATSVAATAKALSALGGGDGGGGSAPSMGGAGGGGAAPQFNVVGQGGANQIAESMANRNSQPIKAFVVGSDVTTQQGLNRGIVQNATLG
jgi:hypothetical protein